MKEALKTLPRCDRVALRAQNDDLVVKNQRLSEMFRLAQQKRFGKSNEVYLGQGELFNEAEELVEEAADVEEETITYTRQKPKREKISADIPRERVIHDISDEDTSEKLEFIPAQVKVIVNVRSKCACKA
jgi:hypothetical protein